MDAAKSRPGKAHGGIHRVTTDHHRGLRASGVIDQRAVIAEVLEHFPAALIATLWILDQCFHHHGADTRVNGGIHLFRRNRFFVHNFVNDGGDVLSREGLLAGDHLVEHDAQGKDVAAPVDGAAFHLFRGHVAGRAHDVRGLLYGAELQDFRGAEVGDLDGVVGGEHQVGGLNVAVHHVAFVGELQGAASLIHNAQNARQREGVAIVEESLEALSFDQLHGDVVETVFFAGVENHDDIGMR